MIISEFCYLQWAYSVVIYVFHYNWLVKDKSKAILYPDLALALLCIKDHRVARTLCDCQWLVTRTDLVEKVGHR